MRNGYKIIFIHIILICISSIIGISIICGEIKFYNKIIILLPIFFSFLSIIFYKVYYLFGSRIVITIFILTYFVRMVIIPFLFFIAGYENLILLNEIKSDTIDYSVLLTIYEFFVVMFFLTKFNRKYVGIEEVNLDGKRMKITKLPLVILIAFSILCIIVFPKLLYSFKFLLNESTESIVNFYSMRNSIPAIVYWSFSIIVEILRPIIIILILIIINIKMKRDKLMIVLFSIAVVLLNSMITTNENARYIYILLGFIILIMRLYPFYGKKMFLVMIVIISIVSVNGLIKKSEIIKGSNQKNKLIYSTFNSYFSGIENIATSLNLKRDPFEPVIIKDFVSSIPFNSLLFKIDNTSKDKFNKEIYEYREKKDQIIPLIGQGVYYFGFVLSPILSVLIIYIGIVFEIEAIKTSNIGNIFSYTFAAIFCAMTPVMYNFTIFLSNFFILILPICLYTNKFMKVEN